MRTKQDRDRDKQSDICSTIADIFQQVRKNHLTHSQYLERVVGRVWSLPAYKNLPAFRKSYIDGYHQALYNQFVGWGEFGGLDWRVLLDGQYLLSEDVPHGKWSECVPDGGRFFHKGTLDLW